VRIALIVEGKTETAFLPHLRKFLETRLTGRMPKLDPVPRRGRLPTHDKLKRVVERLLDDGKRSADAVIALTDVYTGTKDFTDAADAKQGMRSWVGPNERFHPHAAQHDFEAWLIPYWSTIQKVAGSESACPGASPEAVNRDNPPAHRLQTVFRTGRKGKAYVKPRDANRILHGQDLLVAANACPELKAFLNTILALCGGGPIP